MKASFKDHKFAVLIIKNTMGFTTEWVPSNIGSKVQDKTSFKTNCIAKKVELTSKLKEN